MTSEDSPTEEQYKGVFDLPDSAGLTPSERILAQLSRRAFALRCRDSWRFS
jgi:hypothetical protein